MKTSVQNRKSIRENLLDPEFIKMLQGHPVVKAKAEQAKQDFAAVKAVQDSTK